ncbi:ribosome maturation factor RimM [Oxobacter pfennigii]|uniref:Ribosome maturation factor RimM n=1 Tax=Oxobacter pfennigii TaxID=36849 RepID=A0A0P8YW55_9CLOT|nr:ribosome maturation factor RimM [Oxobacter pfennigii]
MVEYMRIGKIVNTQGIKGEVRVIPLTEDINRFDDLNFVFLDDEKLVKLEIEQVKYHKNFVLIKFMGYDDMSKSETLKDNYILIDRANAIKLPKGSYFVSDLINLSVYEKDVFLGKIIDILTTGSNDVYIVKDKDREILIPALKSVVKEININEGKMEVELPEGLME